MVRRQVRIGEYELMAYLEISYGMIFRQDVMDVGIIILSTRRHMEEYVAATY